ncbi:glycosyl hydrolase [Photobacterium kishitanii]|nr:glycosyl hydrolase [Photobacterium kishitanii]
MDSLSLCSAVKKITFPASITVTSTTPQIHSSLLSSSSSSSSSVLSEAVVIAECELHIAPDAKVYGDGFQMLSQTAGTFAHPKAIGRCPDNNAEYRIYPQAANQRYYNYLVIEDGERYVLFGFTSCHRFAGYFECQDNKIIVCIDGENCAIPADETNHISLENWVVLSSETLADLYTRYAALINIDHPSKKNTTQAAPIGWCSWYAYYAGVSAADIQRNVDHMQGDNHDIEWVLLDDGYQAFMGDWLSPSDHFSGGVQQVLTALKAQGKKVGIWLAPFIAEPKSTIFRQHPEWFVRDVDGELLRADKVTYGGWRCTPWYILDTSHPEVLVHLTHVVKTMQQQWGVDLFKLDANYWGTLKGQRYQSSCTGVEAYRLGMKAIAEGAGDAWLLGCNAPMWPSLGLVDAMRVSDDVERNSYRFNQIAKETFYRSWQHRQLWQIDPDCATFIDLQQTNNVEAQAADSHSYSFHRNALLASGGLLLSGDPLAQWNSFAHQSFLQLVQRQHYSQQAAVFDDLNLTTAKLPLNHSDGSVQQLQFVFNYIDEPAKTVTLHAGQATDWFDYWSGECVAKNSQTYKVFLVAGLASHVVYTVSR